MSSAWDTAMLKEKDTKRKVLKAALDLFTELSYATVTIDDVARKARVSKGAVFHYFDSKIELAKGALALGMERLWMKGIHNQLNRCKTPEEKIWVIIDSSLSSITEQSKLVKFVNDLYVYCKDKNGTVEMLRKAWRDYVKTVEVALNGAGVPNPKLKSRILCACMDGLIYQMLIIQDLGKDLEPLKKEIYNLFLKNGR